MPVKLILVAGLLARSTLTYAHGGGLNASGCHNDRKRGGYHCHNGNPQPQSLYRAPEPAYTLPFISSPQSSIPDFDYKVQIAQKLLAALGYELGSADGMLGSKTSAAISGFQAASSLPQTGTVNDALIDALIMKLGE